MKKVKKDIKWLDGVIIGLLKQTVGQIWDSCNKGLLYLSEMKISFHLSNDLDRIAPQFMQSKFSSFNSEN